MFKGIRSLILIVILIALLPGCEEETFQPIDLSIEFNTLSEIEGGDDFSIEEYDFDSLVDGKGYLVFDIGPDRASLIVFDVMSFKTMDVDLLTYEVLNSKEYDVGSFYQTMYIDRNGVFTFVEDNGDIKDFIHISFTEDKRRLLSEDEKSIPIISKLKDSYFYTTINSKGETEFLMSINKFNPSEGRDETLKEYTFTDDGKNIVGTMVTTLGAIDANHEVYNPNYIYYQTVEFSNVNSTNPNGEFTLVEFDHELGGIEEQWEMQEQVSTLWGYYKDGTKLIYSEYREDNHRKEVGKALDIEKNTGWIFPLMDIGKEIREVYTINPDDEIMLISNDFMVMKYDGVLGNYNILTEEYTLGIGNLMIYETDDFFNFAYEGYKEQGKSLIYYRMKKDKISE